MATEDELQGKREKIVTLQEQIAEEQAKRAELVRANEADVVAAQLDDEIARLEAVLESEQAQTEREFPDGDKSPVVLPPAAGQSADESTGTQTTEVQVPATDTAPVVEVPVAAEAKPDVTPVAPTTTGKGGK